jgi:hypothetical protein
MHWTAEGKTDAQLAPRQIDGEWYLHVSDTHNALAERDEARETLVAIARQVERASGMTYKMRAAFLDRVGAMARGALANGWDRG